MWALLKLLVLYLKSKQFYKSTSKQLRKSCDDFNLAQSTVRGQQRVLVNVTWRDFHQSQINILRWGIAINCRKGNFKIDAKTLCTLITFSWLSEECERPTYSIFHILRISSSCFLLILYQRQSDWLPGCRADPRCWCAARRDKCWRLRVQSRALMTPSTLTGSQAYTLARISSRVSSLLYRFCIVSRAL